MITVVGGTYHEICFEPEWNEIYGSGLRACLAINSINPNEYVEYWTVANEKTSEYLKTLEHSHSNLKIEIVKSTVLVEFHYSHPLSSTSIFPRLDTIMEQDISLTRDNILQYGMIDANVIVKGKKVVYDPQSPIKPNSFSSQKSTAEELIYVVNESEAYNLTNSRDLKVQLTFFFKTENALAVIIKKGPKGATLYTDESSISIPAYRTSFVWPIGSGDVFSAIFANSWFSGSSIRSSAELASWSTAQYCNSNTFNFSSISSTKDIIPFSGHNIYKNQVYLAGPFFSMSERWLINEIYIAFKSIGVKIFSPFHQVGIGMAKDVVSKDIEAINESMIIFAIVDGLDSGTLFEIGYAVSRKIPVVAFTQKESNSSLTMLEGTNCIIESDLSTAIYKTIWNIANE